MSDWKKDKYKSYIEIANKYRVLYLKLNKYSHYRSEELQENPFKHIFFTFSILFLLIFIQC